MAMKYLGETLDIHAGGVDLVFPHHENEIAQSEAITGKPFARFWLHAEFLIVEGAEDVEVARQHLTRCANLLAQGYSPEALRYLLASVPYRKKLNFTLDGLKAAATSIERLRNFKLRLETDKFPEGEDPAMTARAAEAGKDFEEALDDDLNTAEALAAIFEYVRETNTAMDAGEFRAGNATGALDLLARFDSMFDVLRPTEKAGGASDAEIDALIAERTQAKKAKNFARADEIRKQLARCRRHPRRHQGRRALEKEMNIRHARRSTRATARRPDRTSLSTTPIYTASSYFYESMEQLDRVFGRREQGFAYSRYDNPTSAALEELMTRSKAATARWPRLRHGGYRISPSRSALPDRRKRIVAANALYGATVAC